MTRSAAPYWVWDVQRTGEGRCPTATVVWYQGRGLGSSYRRGSHAHLEDGSEDRTNDRLTQGEWREQRNKGWTPGNTNMVAREGYEARRLEAMESDRGGTVIIMPLTELLLLRSINFLLRASQWLPTQTVYNFFKRFQGEKNNIYLIIFWKFRTKISYANVHQKLYKYISISLFSTYPAISLCRKQWKVEVLWKWDHPFPCKYS